MFKPESYIAPLLMGYIEKYVKVNHDDFQLSLWGGDVVLSKLDLRLDAMDKALNLPITFCRGHIHELRMHVPWTKLGSEPVVITINTIECVLRLRDSAQDEQDGSSSYSGSTDGTSTGKVKSQKPTEPDLPPGYLQTWLSRITNNINIVINNLILKFVEDDIVLSLNVKSAECYTVNQDWARAFVELSATELVLRRVVDFHDLTVCLDKRNASGMIESYQDPLLYRCSITCRMHMLYESLTAKLPLLTMFNVFCDKLDISLSDTQLPMFLRLMELCIALYYGTLEMSGPVQPPRGEDSISAQVQGMIASQEGEVDVKEYEQDGWASWAWSYVPSIIPDSQESDQTAEDSQQMKRESAILALGFYCAKSSVCFKLTETVLEGQYHGSQSKKIPFKPCLTWEAEGITMEILLKGITFFNVQIGITSTCVMSEGEAICGTKDLENKKDTRFFRSALPVDPTNKLNYLSDSLFDPGGAEQNADNTVFIFDPDKHLEKFTENFALQRFGGFWFDYVYTMEEPPAEKRETSRSSAASMEEGDEDLKENSAIRFLLGPVYLLVCSSMVQRLNKFLYCARNHDYEPYSKPVKEVVDESRPPPSQEEVKKLEEFIPGRSYHLTILKPKISIQANDLPQYDVTKKNVVSLRKARRSKSKRSAESQPQLEVAPLPTVFVQAERLDVHMTSCMYPRRLVRAVSKMAAPPGDLLHQCHSHMDFKMIGLQSGLTAVDSDGKYAPTQKILQPLSASYYKKTLLLPMYWKNALQPRREVMYELAQFSFNITKAQTLLLGHLGATWWQGNPNPQKLTEISLLQDIFKSPGRSSTKQPVFFLMLSGLALKRSLTEAAESATGTLSSVQASLLIQEGSTSVSTPVLCGPVDTSNLPNKAFFTSKCNTTNPTDDLVTFTFQIPKNPNMPQAHATVLLEVSGLAGCLDPSLYDWLCYAPIRKMGTLSSSTSAAQEPAASLDPTLAEVTSPLNKTATSQGTIENLSELRSLVVYIGSLSGSNATMPTATQSRTRTRSLTAPRTDGLGKGDTEPDEQQDTSKGFSWAKMFADVYPLVKIMEVQVGVQSSCVFFPTKHVRSHDSTLNIPYNVRRLLDQDELSDMLVVCCPSLTVRSSGHKTIKTLQEIPIKALEQSVAGEKLPWEVKLKDFSVYSFHKSHTFHYLVKPASVSTTVAVTTKYCPITSDNISSLGLCIHADMNTVCVACSNAQIQLLYDMTMDLVKTMTSLVSSVELMRQLYRAPDKTSSTQDTVPPLRQSPSPHLEPTLHRQASASSQWGLTDVAPNTITGTTMTETSDSLSVEGSMVTDGDHGSAPKLSLWLQWTLMKFVLSLYTTSSSGIERRLQTEVEELTTGIDMQSVYSKVKCKVEAINMCHSVKRSGQDTWQAGSLDGVILSCAEHLAKNIQISSNRPWSSQSLQASPSMFSMDDLKPTDSSHGFLSFTFTRALKKSLKKKLHWATGEAAAGQLETGAPREFVYLDEICLTVQPFDVVVNFPVMVETLEMFKLKSSPSALRVKTMAANYTESVRPKSVMPLLSSSMLPLVYINATNVRLFLPSCGQVSTERQKTTAQQATKKDDSFDHDVCVFQIGVLSLTPQADNPLPRVVLAKEIYRKALHSGITNQMGSEVEDRQYQLDVHSWSLSTGLWRDFSQNSEQKATSLVKEVQNPAVEWNYLTKEDTEAENVRLVPMATSFDLQMVAAPVIVYQPPDKDPLLVCGYSLEANATSDMDFYLSTNQVKLLYQIFNTNINHALMYILGSSKLSKETSQDNLDYPRREESSFHDSGVESEASTRSAAIPSHFSRDIPTSSTKVEFDWSTVTPFDMLLTAGRISFMVYGQKEINCIPKAKSKSDLEWKDTPSMCDTGTESSSNVTEGSVRKQTGLVPLLYAYFSQPHSLLTCQPGQQKMELSCYDIVLKGAKPDYVITDERKSVPEPGDFTVHWLETRPGQPDIKTGIPPSLYTFRVLDLLGKPDISLQLERPLKVNLSFSKILQLMSMLREFYPEMEDLPKKCSTESSSSTTSRESSTPLTGSPKHSHSSLTLLSKIQNIHLQTMQVVVAMETFQEKECPALQVGVSEVSVGLSFQTTQEGSLQDILCNSVIRDFLVKTSLAQKTRVLLGPITWSGNLDLQWGGHSGPPTWPRVLLCVECEVVPVYLGQEHWIFAKLVQQHLKTFVQEVTGGTTCQPAKENTRERFLGTELDKPAERSPGQIRRSTDDLRTGDFDYVTDDGGASVLPQNKEIVFWTDCENGRATMSWSYTEPRAITRIGVTPIPFNLPQQLDARYINEDLKVPCILQYWDMLKRQFHDYGEFEVSENEATHYDLPDVTSSNTDDIAVAQIWRVLVLHPRDKDSDCALIYGGSNKGDGTEPILSPLALAASLKLDSAFAPALVPVMHCSFMASVVQLRLANHLNHLGKEVPPKLVPFHLDSNTPSDQEFLVLSVSNPVLNASYVEGPRKQLQLQARANVTCDVVEYRYLTMLPVLDSVDIMGGVSWTTKAHEETVKADAFISPVELTVGQGAIHTLNCSMQAWSQVGKSKQVQPVMHYYLLCNDTQDTLRLSQVGSDESIALKSRDVHPYSWRTHKEKQLLRISSDSISGLWCDGIDIEKEGTVTRCIDKYDQTVYLVITIRKLTNTQKQVVISGQIYISSRLSQHLEVKILGQKGTTDGNLTLGAGLAIPSVVAQPSDVRALKIRMMGVKMPWSQEVQLFGEKTDTKLVKVPLREKNSYFHVWCHSLCEVHDDIPQYLVVFTPLFIVRTQLPSTLLLNIETPRLKTSQQLELEGQGHQHQLTMIGGDLTHTITFQLNTNRPLSSPPIALSSGMIEQVETEPCVTPNIHKLAYNWKPQAKYSWPYNSIEEQPPSSSDGFPSNVDKGPHQVSVTRTSTVAAEKVLCAKQPDIDLQVTLTQYWPGCNTLLIDVAPHWLIANESGLDLWLVEDDEKRWQLSADQTFALPSIKGLFQLGIAEKDDLHLSEPIRLSDEDNWTRYLPSVSGLLYKHGHLQITLFISESQDIITRLCYLTVHSTIHDNMRVVTIRERLACANQTGLALDMLCYAVPLTPSKVHLDFDARHCIPLVIEETNHEEAFPLLYWKLPPVDHAEDRISDVPDYAQYISLRCRNQPNAAADGSSTLAAKTGSWSVPVRLRLREAGSRHSLAVPCLSDEGLADTKAITLTVLTEQDIAYILLSEDRHPAVELHNNCEFAICFGQALGSLDIPDVTVLEEAELIPYVPSVQPYTSYQYDFSTRNSKFPEMDTQSVLPKLHLAGTSSTTTQVPHLSSCGDLAWSNPIDISFQLDLFVSIPDISDVKIHVEKVGHTTHVFVDPITRAEISAKEIRSRIRGQDTVRVEMGSIKKEHQKPRDKENKLHSSKAQSVLKHSQKNAMDRSKSLHVLSPSRRKLEMSLVCKQVALVLQDETTRTDVMCELLRITADSFFLGCSPYQNIDLPQRVRPSTVHNVVIDIGDLQIDNQLHGKGNFDFPVIFLKQGGFSTACFDEDFLKLSMPEKLTSLRDHSLLVIEATVCNEVLCHRVTVQEVELTLKASTLYIEDSFAYESLRILENFMPTLLSPVERNSTVQSCHVLPKSIRFTASTYSSPIRLQRLTIQPMGLLLSVHACLKLFIASDNTPLSFTKFEISNVFTSCQQLTRCVIMHYVTGAVFRAGWVVGSLEILGNPTGLVRSVGTGVADLFRMPYEGLTRGPGAFVSGVSSGMTSLFRNLSTGTLTSITNFASSVSRNMDRLSLDTAHQERQEEVRRHRPAGITEGLQNGLTGFGLSILGAVAGIADQPLQTFTQPTPAVKATGVVTGMGKGLVGAVTKPIGGAAELVCQTGMGLLQGAGLTKFALPKNSPAEKPMSEATNGSLKFSQKMLQTLPVSEVAIHLEANQRSSANKKPVKVCLLLTTEVLFVVNMREDCQHQGFAVSEIECQPSVSDGNIFFLIPKLQDKKKANSSWSDGQFSNNERVAAFVDSTSRQTAGNLPSEGQLDLSGDKPLHLASTPRGSKLYEFHVEAKYRDLFLAMFTLTKKKMMGDGFPM